jgi:hypothetical protein
MPMNSMPIFSNSYNMSNVDVESSMRWLSASTMTK